MQGREVQCRWMTSLTRYRFLDLATFPAGPGQVAVLSRFSGRSASLPLEDAQFLLSCQRFRTLAEHAADIAAARGLPATEIEGIGARLAALAGSGLLLPEDEVRARALRSEGVPPPQVQSHGVLTRDRPASLLRSLEGFLANARRHGRRPDFVIVDDSPGADTRERTLDGLRRLAGRFGAKVRYAGPGEKDRFAVDLSRRSGVPLRLVRFALRNDAGISWTCGANHNALSLHCAGQIFTSTDDDIYCRPAPLSRQERDLQLLSGPEPTQFAFFASKDEAAAALAEVDLDVLGVHEQLLGRGVGGCLARLGPDAGARVDFDGMDGRFLSLLDPDAAVRITQLGLYGDSGMGSPLYYLMLRGDSRERLLRSPETYARWQSRQIMRGVSCPTISDGAYLMAYALGRDNRAPLPPFFPVFRNDDGVFGATLRLCQPGGFIGHLPVGLWHEPEQPRRFPPDAMHRGAGQAHGTDVLLACLGLFRAPLREGPARMDLLGRFLREMGQWPIADFEREVQQQLVQARCARMEHLEDLLARHDASPACWAADVRLHVQALRESLARPSSFFPADLTGRPLRARRVLMQELVGSFGELLRAWPAIWAAARALQGGLALPVEDL